MANEEQPGGSQIGRAVQGKNAARCLDHALCLVEWASETGTPGEAAFGEKAAALLRGLPCFADHPERVRLIGSHGDPQRQIVVGLLRGAGRRTLVLAGHYDVVSAANYRDLADLAFSPGPLLAALRQDLASRPLSAAEEKARADFESGDFLPGRGLLDMKSGIAAGITTLENFAGAGAAEGNLLLVMTPDEEASSQGMRAFRDILPDLAREWDLEIAGGINLDATSDQGDGAGGRAIYKGTIGKLLPFAMVLGKPSHASYPFDGASAHLIAAHLMTAMETNPDLCDRSGAEVSPPPICLDGGDFRAGYDVTTPEQVWLAFNWLSHSRSPSALMAQFHSLAENALTAAMAAFARNRQAFTGDVAEPEPSRVLTVADLMRLVAAREGQAALDEILETPPAHDNPLALSRALCTRLVSRAGLNGPAIVLGFGSLHYPHSHLDPDRTDDAALISAIETARQEIFAATGVQICWRDTFVGISDMSFLGNVPPPEDARIVAENTPARRYIDHVPDTALRFPVVNIGPWGREYHQRLERVHAPYAFETLPDFLTAIVARFFDQG